MPVRLPVVPSRDEVKRLLKAVRSLKYRTILTVAYGAGLRVTEVCRLQVPDIDSEQMVLRIRGGKGGKDRLVPLSPRMLIALRRYWAEERPPSSCLFPGRQPDAHQQGCGTQGSQVRGPEPGSRKADAPFAAPWIRHPFARGWRGYTGRPEHPGSLARSDDGPLCASDHAPPGQGEKPSRWPGRTARQADKVHMATPCSAPKGQGRLRLEVADVFGAAGEAYGTGTSRHPSNAK